METLVQILLVAHFLGLAAIIGPFFLQMRRKTGLELRVMITGAFVQVITGAAMLGIQQATHDEDAFSPLKAGIKLGIGLIVLVALIVGRYQQRKGAEAKVRPWFHTAGGLAIINIFVAVLMR